MAVGNGLRAVPGVVERRGGRSLQGASQNRERLFRHLRQALNNLEDSLLDRPLMLVHGKDLAKPNLVSGIIPAPIPVDQTLVEAKKPSLLALADLIKGTSAIGKPPFLDGRREIKTPLVHQRDETQPIGCPFGHVQRIVTGGEGGIANVHVVKITKGTPHLH